MVAADIDSDGVRGYNGGRQIRKSEVTQDEMYMQAMWEGI